ncbi:MAG TPA: hypothetical protein VJN01_13990, partial [Xanthomonadales bacterium]|nr:hypothetical protein [Xanthomonadales bacterium]
MPLSSWNRTRPIAVQKVVTRWKEKLDYGHILGTVAAAFGQMWLSNAAAISTYAMPAATAY